MKDYLVSTWSTDDTVLDLFICRANNDVEAVKIANTANRGVEVAKSKNRTILSRIARKF